MKRGPTVLIGDMSEMFHFYLFCLYDIFSQDGLENLVFLFTVRFNYVFKLKLKCTNIHLKLQHSTL